jgi:hypothetical protein
MIEIGFENVRTVVGGGAAMEKYFEYYRGGKIINPITGKVIDLRKK